ncbi:MAG: hypothetical protein RH942_03560 [Kiloniellaceae bacterium]
MTATIETECAEQARWRLRPEFRDMMIFDKLVQGEFLPPERQQAVAARRLQRLIAFAIAEVPYYRDLFAGHNLSATDIRAPEDLAKLPLLSKVTLMQQGERLRAEHLPAGERIFGTFSSSGTTGRPAVVTHTLRSNMMFTALGQRGVRWNRWDPLSRVAEIRLPSQLPRRPEGRPVDLGETCDLPFWRYLGRFFQTGDYRSFSVFNPVDEQVAWLNQVQPNYLSAYSETLEQLALAARGKPLPETLRGLAALSEQLTEGMRRRISEVFGTPISQNYGLNEAGIVALRCPAGRYHVNSEHCLVEIVDYEGALCRAGQSGRIVVTALNNLAMPLIRYDTDDVAEVTEGPCPCGRTLPSFGNIVGRYSRIAYLPEGTLGYVGALREALEEMPGDLLRDLRQFQVHQFRDGRFELRLRAVAPLGGEVEQRIKAAWKAATEGTDLTLSVVPVKEIQRPPSGKYQDFTSDFVPALGEEDEGSVPAPKGAPGGPA